jgi:hypothetical protein
LPDVIPLQPSADWAASQAKAILDGHVTNDTEAAGLVRFLTAWLNLQLPSGTKVTAAHTFAVKLAAPDATLSTLLAEPTGEPHRVGILSDPQFLTARPTITRRGVWIMKNLLCSEVPPPPPDIPASDPNAMGVTRREKLESAVDSPSCKACHNLSDPTGDALEHFDATGNYRELDAGQAVDSSATLQQPMQLSWPSPVRLPNASARRCSTTPSVPTSWCSTTPRQATLPTPSPTRAFRSARS